MSSTYVFESAEVQFSHVLILTVQNTHQRRSYSSTTDNLLDFYTNKLSSIYRRKLIGP